MSGKDERAEEIVIVRRRGSGEDDHHHGGVWKIAYADFMTAMMAFFLVMWLINASNTETRASIASYFNPIKLTDNVSRKKGLLDIDEKANATEKPKKKGDEATGKEKRSDEKSKRTGKDTANEGAKDRKRPTEANDGKAGPTHGGATSDASEESASQRGAAFRDPFNPRANARLAGRHEEAGLSATGTEAAKAANTASALEEGAEKLRKQAEAVVRQLGISGGPGIDVTIEGDAIVLSLTDTSTFGMFAIGSAEPNGDLLKLVQGITPVVASSGGRIIVRGHTDSRPFRGDRGSNNWRLSMARAEAVYGMLVRANIEDARFERIEGHADRKPRIAQDREAAANRRIEILIRKTDP